MNRVEFTSKIAHLIVTANETLGYDVLGDWWLRDSSTQRRLFEEGKSKCDGFTRKSAHQSGCALDIYIVGQDGKLSWDRSRYNALHDYWDQLGGKPRIEWDLGHFEG